MPELEALSLATIEVDHREHVEPSVLLRVVLPELGRDMGLRWIPRGFAVRGAGLAGPSYAVRVVQGVSKGLQSGLCLERIESQVDEVSVPPKLCLLVLPQLVQLDGCFDLAAHLRRANLVADFLDRRDITEPYLRHVVRRDRAQKAHVEHDEGNLVAPSDLLKLGLVAGREGPAHLAGHEGTHQHPIVRTARIAGQVEPLDVLRVSHAEDQIDKLLSSQLRIRQIDVEQVRVALNEATQLGRDDILVLIG